MADNPKRISFLIISIVILILIIGGTIGYNYWLQAIYPLKYEDSIILAANQNNVDPYLIAAIIREESRFNPQSVSRKGAIGLMQIMPKTAGWISQKKNFKYKTQAELLNTDLNIQMGTWYFAYLQNKYKSLDAALIAYNGGTANVDRWFQSTQDISVLYRLFTYKESKEYVEKVKNSLATYKWLYPNAFKK